MPKFKPIVALDRSLSVLVKQRLEHQTALAEIDAIFAKYGIHPDNGATTVTKKVTAKPEKATGKKRRKRGRFAQTAEEFVLGLLDGKTLTSKEINTAWKESGRKASADNTLTLMFKKKLVKRAKLKEGRGSNYSVA